MIKQASRCPQNTCLKGHWSTACYCGNCFWCHFEFFFQRCWICSWTCMGFHFSIAGLTTGMNDVKREKVHFLKEHKHFWICWFKLTSKDEMPSQRKLMEILKQIERPRPSTIDQMLYVWYRCIGINSWLVSKQLCRLPE